MSHFEWILETISKKHDRSHFDCGEPDLNSYLKKFARQNAQNNISQTFVASYLVVDAKHDRAKKFYLQYGFHELIAQSLTLFIPTKTIVVVS
jgi:hypothetical protein